LCVRPLIREYALTVDGLFLSFGEFGPGDNIGLIAAKIPATAIRGQFYGIAAAMGKIGAFAGAYAFDDVTLFSLALADNRLSTRSVDPRRRGGIQGLSLLGQDLLL
jgi:hypothetical protein